MISRHIARRVSKTSSFTDLVRYITNQQQHERVGTVRITNCHNADLTWALAEIKATQQHNQRAQSDRVYHLLISFAASDQPTASTLEAIEERLCGALGYGEHQRISAVHHDTDNLHIHVAINKIHPVRHTLHDPYRAYRTLATVSSQLEREHGLQPTNHVTRQRGAHHPALVKEHHSGLESLLGWIRRTCLSSLQSAPDWPTFHQVLHDHGLTLRSRGNGFVIITDAGLAVKASAIARTLAKTALEQHYGVFQPPHDSDSPNHEQRQKAPNLAVLDPILPQLTKTLPTHTPSHYSATRPIHVVDPALYVRYQEAYHQACQRGHQERAMARRQRQRQMAQAKQKGRLWRAAIGLLDGRDVNKKWLYQVTYQQTKRAIDQVRHQYETSYRQHTTTRQCLSWLDWLQQQAMAGDAQALAALRARQTNTIGTGNCLTAAQAITLTLHQPPTSITKTGVVRHLSDNVMIHDDGKAIHVPTMASAKSIETALALAQHRFGHTLMVQGSDAFKEQVMAATVRLNLALTFSDPILEQHHQRLRALARLSAKSEHDVLTKAMPQQTIPSLTASQPTRLQKQPGQPSRREATAAERYMVERNSKRQVIPSILPHRPYQPGQQQTLQWAGLRQIGHDNLALFNDGKQILVMTINNKDVYRFQELAIGTPITLSSTGQLLTKTGRRR